LLGQDGRSSTKTKVAAATMTTVSNAIGTSKLFDLR